MLSTRQYPLGIKADAPILANEAHQPVLSHAAATHHTGANGRMSGITAFIWHLRNTSLPL